MSVYNPVADIQGYRAFRDVLFNGFYFPDEPPIVSQEVILASAGDALRYLDYKNLLKPDILIDGTTFQDAMTMVTAPHHVPENESRLVKYILLRHAIELKENVHTLGYLCDKFYLARIEESDHELSSILLLEKQS